MKKESASWKIILTVIAFLPAVLLLSSCEKKIDKIKKNEILTLPSLTVKDFSTVFDDSGKVELILSSPLMETYDHADVPYSEFKDGIKVLFYDGNKDPVGSVNAKYARFENKKNLWELRDSVVVINQTNDKLETEQLFWDQTKNTIYTDRFVKITNEDQTVLGSGFESDTHLNKRSIKNITGSFYVGNE
jgi:LPS export ABC transporter protein LptC